MITIGMIIKNLNAIVAHDQNASGVLIDTLKSIGVQNIRTADDGAEALKLICVPQVNLLVLDLELLRDGLSALRQLRKLRDGRLRQLPVIVVTAYATKERVEAIRDAGATEVLTKPWTRGNLLGRLNAIVERPRPFIDASTYVGPDRRRSSGHGHAGPFRRQADGEFQFIEIG